MALPDCRIRFPSGRIDFSTDVGLTGLDHDDYPLPGGQARFDHMRLFLIGLLAQQASYSAPSEYRDGTPWFDLNTLSLKIWNGSEWVSYASTIALTDPDDDGAVVTLADWYAAAQPVLDTLSPEIVFSGSCVTNNTTNIPIPSSAQAYASTDSKVFMYINGLLIDPHNCVLIGSPPTTIQLSNVELSSGDVFTVMIRRMNAAAFVDSTITI